MKSTPKMIMFQLPSVKASCSRTTKKRARDGPDSAIGSANKGRPLSQSVYQALTISINNDILPAHCIQYIVWSESTLTNTAIQAQLANLTSYRTKQELAYEALREAIITCKFPPGMRLLEGELAQQLGMSRSPVREALKRLSHEGLVKEIPHVGVTVAEVGLESLHELYLILAALEGLACREAALRRSPETMMQIARELEAMDRALAKEDYIEWAQHNVEFHRLCRQDCAMPQLLRMLDDTWSRVRRFQIHQGAAAERAVQSEPEHRAIYEAIQARDPERTEQAVKAHYLEGDRQFTAYLRTLSQTSV